jgi:hypothetical protein
MKTWWLRLAKPTPAVDKRAFIIRLLESVRLVVRGNRSGVTYVGIKGGADF